MNKRKPTNKEVRARLVPVVELLSDLYAIVERKCRKLGLHNPIGDRGTMCVQLYGGQNGTYLFIMEGGYRGALFPRVVYKFQGSFPGTYEERLREAIHAERKEANLVAKIDTRSCICLPDFAEEFDLKELNGEARVFSKEVNIRRAKQAVQDAERNLAQAKSWFERAQEKEDT